MRTITPGAARRRETTEAVRERMAHLFDVAMRADPPPAVPEPVPSAAAPASSDPDPPLVDQPPQPQPQPQPPPLPPPAEEVAIGDGLPEGFGKGRPGPGGLRGLLARMHPGLLPDRRAMVGLGVLLALAIGYAVQHFWLGRPHLVDVPTALTAVEPGPPASGRGPGEPPGPSVVVDVAGKVQHPGLLTLPTGSRVADAIRAAGGALAGTDTDALNLARLLNDGEQVLVGAPAAAQPPGVPGPASPVSINQATADQLDALPGVGPALAQRIVQYRHQHGSFRALDQLRRISGIGERKYQELKPLITL